MVKDYLIVLIPSGLLLGFLLLMFFGCWWLERLYDRRHGIKRVRVKGFVTKGELVFVDEKGKYASPTSPTTTPARALNDAEPGETLHVKLISG